MTRWAMRFGEQWEKDDTHMVLIFGFEQLSSDAPAMHRRSTH